MQLPTNEYEVNADWGKGFVKVKIGQADRTNDECKAVVSIKRWG